MGTFSEIYLGIEAEARKNAEKNFFLDYKRESYRPIILYGAGGNCEFACFALLDIGGIKPTCICDTNRTGSYKYLEDSYAIITPSQLIENYSDAFVLITTWRYEKEIREQLCKMGVMDSQIYFLRWTKILPEKFKEQYLNEYQWAYEFFLDDISKQKVINRIKLHLLGTPCPADSLYKDGYFGYPGIRLEDNEIFVDGGAYIGDSVEEFIDAMDNRKKLYKYIYAFEPDSKNFIKAEERISVFKNVELVNYGLWSKKTELGFVNREFEEGIGSALTTHEGKGNTTVSVISLDAFLKISRWKNGLL